MRSGVKVCHTHMKTHTQAHTVQEQESSRESEVQQEREGEAHATGKHRIPIGVQPQ